MYNMNAMWCRDQAMSVKWLAVSGSGHDRVSRVEKGLCVLPVSSKSHYPFTGEKILELKAAYSCLH
jgi:hypothetical protein